MTRAYESIYERSSQPAEPLATGVKARLVHLEGIRAVLFDVYGTLFISASGDVDSLKETRVSALGAALGALGISTSPDAQAAVDCLAEVIRETHAHMRERGVGDPEVDIIDVWQRTFRKLISEGKASTDLSGLDWRRLAVEFEVRANPVWPMPGARECLDTLADGGLTLGIVSNAQFYVRHMFSALLGAEPEGLGFQRDLVYFSFEHGHAKPGRTLFEKAAESLRHHGISAKQCLYVGNDMLNDIFPADSVGFRTALFAGDARSLQRREGDGRIVGLRPDIEITELASIADCIAAP